MRPSEKPKLLTRGTVVAMAETKFSLRVVKGVLRGFRGGRILTVLLTP